MSDNKNTSKNSGQKNLSAGKIADERTDRRVEQNNDRMNVGQKSAQGMEQKKDRANEISSKDDNCGQALQITDIQPQMDVLSSCGCNMGKVDHLEGNAIKLTKNDSTDGQHHFIPTNWVARVDNHVHLKKDAEETRQEWQRDAAS
jgi:hypothetical protein